MSKMNCKNIIYVYKGKNKFYNRDNRSIFLQKGDLFKCISKNNKIGIFTNIPNNKIEIHMKSKYFRKELKKKTIFVSSFCNGPSLNYACRLTINLSRERIKILRKKRYFVFSFSAFCMHHSTRFLPHIYNLETYMSSISNFDYITGIISNEYLTSLPCFYELTLSVLGYSSNNYFNYSFYIIRKNVLFNKKIISKVNRDTSIYKKKWMTKKIETSLSSSQKKELSIIKNNIDNTINFIDNWPCPYA